LLIWWKRRRQIREAKAKSYRSKNIAKRKKRLSPSQEPVDKEWHSEEREHHRIERRYWSLTAVLTFLAVAAASYTVALSKWTLDEARKATSEAHRQTNEAKRQADIAKETGEKQIRAYVVFDGASVEYSHKKNRIKFNFKNVGVTPAFIIDIIQSGTFVPFPFEKGSPPVRFSDYPLTSSLMYGTKKSYSVQAPGSEWSTSVVDDNLTAKTMLKKFSSGMAYLVVAAIYYRDVFGTIHSTKFCTITTVNTLPLGVACQEGNEAN
jgi:hypothetical protein